LKFLLLKNRSIARTAGVDSASIKSMVENIELNFEIEERELKLAKCIIKYADIFTRVLDELLMHGLCEFMYQLATTFTDFYDRCYCVEKDKITGEVRVNYRRILLCEATANVLKQCFEILGIQSLERM
jgi:arginyl-tRNA synthetase